MHLLITPCHVCLLLGIKGAQINAQMAILCYFYFCGILLQTGTSECKNVAWKLSQPHKMKHIICSMLMDAGLIHHVLFVGSTVLFHAIIIYFHCHACWSIYRNFSPASHPGTEKIQYLL